MALSGLVGGGALDALEQLVAQRLLEQRLAEQKRATEAQEAFQQRQLDSIDADRTERRQQTADAQAARVAALEQQARAQQAEAGVRQNIAGVLQMPGLTPEQRQMEVLSGALRGGVDLPSGVQDLLKPPPAPKKRAVVVPGPNGQPISRMVPEDEDAPVYVPPKTAEAKTPTYVRIDGPDGKVRMLTPEEIRAQDGVPTAKGAAGTPQTSPYTAERNQRTRESVDQLIGKVGVSNTGVGSLLANIPGTGARDFAAELDTLKANIAFNELAQMREASKTGGALGAVSERELQLLTSTLGALDAGQSPGQLKAQLQRVRDSLDRWERAKGGGAATGAASDPLGIRRPQ